MPDEPYVLPDDYESDPAYLAILAKLEQPWWKRPVTMVAAGVVVVGAAFFAGVTVGRSDSNTVTPASSISSQPQSQSNNQPAGLSFQQKQQILFKFCTSSAMRGPAGDSSAFPTCMASYSVTDQGMVLPK
ncbi:hypothetical protein [Actinacidiphila oryziradicis]|uniref:Uncharacterized protein n=1 Tax=Actinacidiphila oryziradicis TaxID=2571141 RepID=A0A4U0RSB8_9ACTN|nr:hypothetical protein [Actinacidiphila oryziradicis]TJZ98993.1 hypothetical protein FCI23_47360 [Actinacidiphila oryziradicis]